MQRAAERPLFVFNNYGFAPGLGEAVAAVRPWWEWEADGFSA
jgi:hypothetical protein